METRNNNLDDEMDIDDENDWKAMDSDEEEKDAGNNHNEQEIERDDDVDIGFRSHQFQYGSHGRNRKRSRRENQEEAIYGVFYDSDGDKRNNNKYEDNATTNAPMFVPASKPQTTKAAPLFVAASKKESINAAINNDAPPAPMFVAASNNTNTEPQTKSNTESTIPTPSESTKDPVFVAPVQTKPVSDDTKEEQEEEKRILKEQKEADNRFLELLEKAKDRNKKSRSRPPPTTTSDTTATSTATATTAPKEFSGGSGLGMSQQGLGLPSSFGGGGLGFSAAMEDDETLARKDPTVGTWEKHTKGFGSKLLAKMGWRGSGGLGSNRRTFRGESAKNESNEPTNEGKTAETSTTTPVTDTTSTQAAKKGISRPVEVVVRPSNMGLGFGNFKEASQLKSNRRIEAEVRGIDYDAQLAKEKQKARATRRQKRKQRYGNQYASSSDEEDDENDNGNKSNVQSSAIPTTDDLLSKQSWKATRKTRNKSKGAGLPEIIPYQELIKRQNQKAGSDKVVIIDMRGPSSGQQSKDSSSTKGQTVALGEELLYNLSFLLGTYENKLHSSSRHHETSILRTIHSLDNQIREAEDRLQKAANRRAKLARAHEVAEAVRKEESQPASKKQKVNHLVNELKEIFTPSERKELQFWNVLAPTILGPTMQGTLDNWKPFSSNSNTNRESDRAIVDSFFEWATHDNRGDSEGRILCESMVKKQLIPKLKADIEAQAFQVWDPVSNPYAVLDLYEYLRAKALAFDSESFVPNSGSIRDGYENSADDPNQVFPSNREDEEEHLQGFEQRTSSNLAEYIRHELIREAVYPKLLGAITTWKATLSQHESVEIQNPLHLWILPWLPHIDYPILLPSLLVECKRKLKNALSVLQRDVRSNKATAGVTPFVDLIRPWRIILGPKSLQKMISENTKILAILEKLLQKSFAELEGENHWKSLLRLLFELHGNQLLSDVDFLSLVEGSFLVTWATGVHSFLCGRTSTLFALDSTEISPDTNASISLDSAVEAYRECKVSVLVNPLIENEKKTSSSLSPSLKILREDDRICRMFFSVARMIQIRHTIAKSEQLTRELDSLEPTIQSFSSTRNRRSKEEKEKSRATEVGESKEESRAKAALRRRNVLEPTFREVVEAFASDRGVIFRPKVGATSDGKQVYLFGNKAIYLDGDVVFYQERNHSWTPVSLDQLGTMAS